MYIIRAKELLRKNLKKVAIGRCLSAQLISCLTTGEMLAKVMQMKTEIVLQMITIKYFNYSKQGRCHFF